MNADIEFLCTLPLNLIITNIGKLCTDSVTVETHCGVTCTGCIVADAIVATNVKAGINTQIVDAC